MMTKDIDDNLQVEGDYESAKIYTDEQRALVEAGKVEKAATHAGEQSHKEGEKADKLAVARVKKHDRRGARDR